jgi:hypothetical protein
MFSASSHHNSFALKPMITTLKWQQQHKQQNNKKPKQQ